MLRSVFEVDPRCTLRPAAAMLVAGLALTSCADSVTSPSDVMGGVWTLQSMQVAGEDPFVPAEPDRFTVEFAADGQIAVVADCNQCGGRYTVEDGTLTVTDLACTLVACATPEGEQFAALIDGTSSLESEGSSGLEIESPEGTLALTR
jgi:heat shock protein HslJ